ncbi:MAG: hypothetical protein KTR32_07510 [Granulosicoccus sp.]|nr:hypothetical protein [Granulosicoccus sp.]
MRASSYCSIFWIKYPEIARYSLKLLILVPLWFLSACSTLSTSSDKPIAAEPAISSSEANEEVSNSDPMAAFCRGDHSVFKLSVKDRARLHSICTAWYPGSSVPPLLHMLDGSQSNWKSACATAWDSPDTEREFLRLALSITSAEDRAYPLCYFAILDWDGDGVRDYQVTNSGRFVENDTDLDQDGIPNVRDTDPLNPDAGEQVSCGKPALPEHLQFACNSATPHACQLQQKLYNEFDVVVVNRDFAGSPELIERNLQSIYDAASLVYAEGFRNHPGRKRGDCNGLYTMQTIAFEQCPLIRKQPWDSQDLSCKVDTETDTEASAMAHNGLFTVYPIGANLPRVIQLGTFVHEFAHLWQFAYDVQSEADTVALTSDNLWLVPEFEAVLKEFNWTLPKIGEAAQQEQLAEYIRVLPREEELTIFDNENLTLEGSLLSVHQGAAEYEGLVLSNWARENGNFSTYALGDPWEWHADLFIAYLYLSLEEHIEKHTGSLPISGEFISWFRAHILDNYGNRFFHPNLKPAIYEQFQELLPIEPAAMDELVCRYLINDGFVFSKLKHNSALPFAPKDPPDHVTWEIRDQWQDHCSALDATDA